MPRHKDKTAAAGTFSASPGQLVPAPGADDGFYEEVEHTADLALRCGGPDLISLFRNAARGMYHLMGADHPPGRATEERAISLEAADMEGLLVDWLGELAYLAETGGLVFSRMAFNTLTATRLEAVLGGGRVQRLAVAIKAVTYHQLNVLKTREGYTATVVFDV